jgi:hypothetical protein
VGVRGNQLSAAAQDIDLKGYHREFVRAFEWTRSLRFLDVG